MIEGLITALGLELELTGEEIADVLWLTAHIRFSEQRITANDKSEKSLKTADTAPTATSSEEETISGEEPNQLDKPHADIIINNEDKDFTGLSFQVPDARSLREPLELARALKPLLRWIPTGIDQAIDEEATIRRITDEQVWVPVLKPTLEPWLDLVLVVDESPSMLIWQKTVLEFKRILEHYGVFRNITTWSLKANKWGTPQLHPGIGLTRKNQKSHHSSSELIAPNGQRLNLVASDCVSEIWQNGAMLRMLKLWAKAGPIAITQMLPQWLWERTALRVAANTEFLSLKPGTANDALIAKPLSRRSKVNLDTGIKIHFTTTRKGFRY